MLPKDNMEKVIDLSLEMNRVWKAHRSVGMFQSMEEENEWQRNKKKLKKLMAKLIEEIKEEEVDVTEITGI